MAMPLAGMMLAFAAGCLLWLPARPSARGLLLGGAVLATALVTGIMVVAGLFGQLNRGVILLALLAVFAAAAFSARTRIREFVQQARKSRPARPRLRLSPLPAVLLLAFAVCALLVLFLGIALPPTDWDGLAQNLPMAAFHAQAGNIFPTDTPYRGIRAYPQGGALLLAFDLILEQADILADLVQFPFWLLGGLAVYALARELGAQRANGLFGAAVFAAAPVAILQARSAYFDLEIAALALAALALLLNRRLAFVQRGLIVGCAAGLLAGLKYAGLIYAALLAALFLGAGLAERRPKGEVLRGIALFAACAVALSGVWYLFNWRAFGNPFWPMELKVGSWTIFPGVWTAESFYVDAKPAQISGLPPFEALVAVWREPVSVYAADVRTGGLGPLWFAFGPLSVLAFVAMTFRRPTYVRVAVLVFAVAAFALTPANWHTRYVLASVGAVGACAALVLQQLRRKPQAAAQTVLVILAVLSLLLVPALGSPSIGEVGRNLALPSYERASALMTNVPAVDPAHAWVHENVAPGSTLGYGWGGVVLYPLFRPTLANRLIYVPPGPNYRAALQQVGASHLVTRAGTDDAAAADAERLRAVFRTPTYIIYEVTDD